jgi:hypothetical protein
MKLIRTPKRRTIDYFGIKFELPECFDGYIQAHSDGMVFATALDWRGEYLDAVYLGTVDLEGMSWVDTKMEVLSK